MQYAKYAPLLASSDLREFSFISNGPKGEIKIVVQFNLTENSTIYNLAFGNVQPDGSIDDIIKNNNKDRNKVLATVAATIYEFTTKHPDKFIFFKGSTPERTRLYRMAITNNIKELAIDFDIYGVELYKEGYTVVDFKIGVLYFGFMVKRKKNYF